MSTHALKSLDREMTGSIILVQSETRGMKDIDTLKFVRHTELDVFVPYYLSFELSSDVWICIDCFGTPPTSQGR